MLEFLEWTAWPMTKPPVYGAFHLAFSGIGIAAAIAAAFLLRKKNTPKQTDRIVLSAGVMLAVFELYKQMFYYHVLYDGEYYWWIFPFQLCSIPIYFCLIAPFLKEGKLKDALYDFLGTYTLFSGAVVFVSPDGMLFEYWTLTLHSFLWHIILVFIGLYLGFSGRTGATKKGFLRTVPIYVALCAAALAINFIFWERSGGNINMFYLGPKISSQVVFGDISSLYGWYANMPLYMACTTLGAFLVYLPFTKRNRKSQAKTGEKTLPNDVV
jgi:Predicted integral membrane protein